MDFGPETDEEGSQTKSLESETEPHKASLMREGFDLQSDTTLKAEPGQRTSSTWTQKLTDFGSETEEDRKRLGLETDTGATERSTVKPDRSTKA
jgi:hypothetical protein